MNETQVLALVAEVLGTMPLSAVHQAFGHNSVTYEVALPGRRVIVRMNANASVFTATERNLAALAGLGLPVPTVLASDFSRTRFSFAYLLLNKIPGHDLRYELAEMTHTQMTRMAEQITQYQKRVMALPLGAGYGYVGLGETGPYTSWWDLICFEDTPVQAVRFESYLRQVPPVCFLDDIMVKNVIVQNGELSGLIDFDCVCYGDPLYWLALTAVGVVSDVGAAGQFYVNALKRLCEMTQEQELVLAFYCALMAQDFVRRVAAEETPEWNARIQAATEEWIALCDS